MMAGISRSSAAGKREILFLSVLAAVNFSLAIDKQALSALAPAVQKEFSFTLVELSLVISATSWTYALMQFPAGWLAERFGPKMLLVCATFCWALLTIATPLAVGFTSFMILRILLGLVQAPDWPASVLAVARGVPTARRAGATSKVLSAQYIGVALGGPFAVWIGNAYGWREGFYFFGALGLLMAFLTLATPFSEVDEVEDQRSAAPPVRVSYRRLFGSIQFWATGISYFCLATILGFYVYMLPTYLVSGREVDVNSLYWILLLPFLVLWGATLIAGKLSDYLLLRTGSLWMARASLGAAGMFLSGIGMVAMLAAATPLLIGCCVSLSMLGLGAAQVATWSSVQDLAKGFSGQFAGWVTFCGHLSHSTTLVGIAWLVQRQNSWVEGMLLPILTAAVGTLSWFLIAPHRELEPVT